MGLHVRCRTVSLEPGRPQEWAVSRRRKSQPALRLQKREQKTDFCSLEHFWLGLKEGAPFSKAVHRD